VSARGDEIAALLLRNEQAFLDPQVRIDRQQVRELLAEDFEEFSASGRVWTRDGIIEELATEADIPSVLTPPVLSEFRCRMIAADVALVTYRTARVDPVSGERRAAFRSSIWIVEDARWKVRFHQGTPAARPD
jgi:hypothetical protein